MAPEPSDHALPGGKSAGDRLFAGLTRSKTRQPSETLKLPVLRVPTMISLGE
jgi:hypothetical protein